MDADSPGGLLKRLLGLLCGHRASTSEELEREIQGLVDRGEAQGLIAQGEADMIEAVLDLDETTAGQIMVPRTELAMAPDTAGMSDVIEVIIESGHSRIPIYSEDPDHIKGVIHAKDLLPYWGQADDQVRPRDIMRQPFFVPPAMPVMELLTALKRRRVHLAVVVDEYGGTAGVVTMEDILEEIVGEIEDEYDQEPQRIQEQDDGSLVVDARLEIEELNQHLEMELPDSLPEGSFETVGGFITTILGRVPQKGEQVEYGPLRMVVTAADDRRVIQVHVLPLQSRARASGD